jgi:glycosyltransferase involved in cell wall biosynthesis
VECFNVSGVAREADGHPLKKILFIVSEDWYFVSHRLNLATEAINKGYEVALLSKFTIHRDYLNSLGIKIIDWSLERKSKNPLLEIKAIYHIVKAINYYKPSVVHSVALKPILYTAISRIFTNIDGMVLAFGGLGFVFHSKTNYAKFIKFLITPLLRVLFIGDRVRLIIQNDDDMRLLESFKVIRKDNVRVIRGAGVDVNMFTPRHRDNKNYLVILPARMLWDKGVSDFVACAKYCIKHKVNARFALVGDQDIHNPKCIPKRQLKKWVKTGVVEWWGRSDDIVKVYHAADIVCFPSYHEGLPKSLLEAASCELPIVAYNVSGCREVVEDGKNGILVPFRDEGALLSAVLLLLNDKILRRNMGKCGRKKVLAMFTQEIIFKKTMAVWSEFQ